MGSYGHAVRRDENHAEVVAAARKMGAKVTDVATVKKFCDILVGYKGCLLIVEIKNGKLPASQRKLTPGELECKNDYEAVGVPYYVINSTDEMIHLLNSI